MRNLTYLLPLILLLTSCNALKTPAVAESNQIVVAENAEELLITETFSYQEELALADENTDEKQISSGKVKSDNQKKSTAFEATEDLKVSVKDTIYIDQGEVAIAVESERVARNAHRWAFVPLLTLLISPAFLVGIIVTLVLIKKVRKMPYVTQEALDQVAKARRTLLWTTIGQIVIFILLVLAIIIIAVAFF